MRVRGQHNRGKSEFHVSRPTLFDLRGVVLADRAGPPVPSTNLRRVRSAPGALNALAQPGIKRAATEKPSPSPSLLPSLWLETVLRCPRSGAPLHDCVTLVDGHAYAPDSASGEHTAFVNRALRELSRKFAQGGMPTLQSVELQCPITGELAFRPVLDEAGHTYGNRGLMMWSEHCGGPDLLSSPLTRDAVAQTAGILHDHTLERLMDGLLSARLPLHCAIMTNTLDALDETVLTRCVRTADAMGQHPLHLAAKYAQATDIARLLAAGADANHRDENGRVPLHVAAEHARDNLVALVEQLLPAMDELNPLDEFGVPALAYIIESGHAEAVRAWCEKHGDVTEAACLGARVATMLERPTIAEKLRDLTRR